MGNIGDEIHVEGPQNSDCWFFLNHCESIGSQCNDGLMDAVGLEDRSGFQNREV